MHKLLDNYLCKKYPKIFRDRNKSNRESCLAQGLCVDNGWFYLINALCYNIQQHIDQRDKGIKNKWDWAIKEGKIDQVIALQVKEKFSGLCFYYEGGDEYINGLVKMTESLSYRTCEICGKMNDEVSRNKKGWIRTTCVNHTKEEDLSDHSENRYLDKELFEIWDKIHLEETIMV